MGKFPQLFCLQRRHLGHPNFGTWGLANSIILVFETPLHSRFCAFMQSYPMLGMGKAMSIIGGYRQVRMSKSVADFDDVQVDTEGMRTIDACV